MSSMEDARDENGAQKPDLVFANSEDANDLHALRLQVKRAQASLAQLIADDRTPAAAPPADAAPADAPPADAATRTPTLMFDLETLSAMLTRENELRLSPQTQALYTEAEKKEDDDWMMVTDRLQRQVMREFGVAAADENRALLHFRAAPTHHPQLKAIPLYHRYQRSRNGDFRQGDTLPQNLHLYDLENRLVDFSALAGNGSGSGRGENDENSDPLVVVAGSYS